MNTKFNFMNVLISLACNDKVITTLPDIIKPGVVVQ